MQDGGSASALIASASVLVQAHTIPRARRDVGQHLTFARYFAHIAEMERVLDPQVKYRPGGLSPVTTSHQGSVYFARTRNRGFSLLRVRARNMW